MRATCLWPAALVLAGACAYPASAQHTIWCAPALQRPLGVAPDACGPGFYWANCHGVFYGPSHYLRPPFAPVQGITPDQVVANWYGGQHGAGQHGAGGQGHGGPNQIPHAIPFGNPYQLFAQQGHPGAGPYPGPAYPGAAPYPGMPAHPGHPGMPPGTLPTPPMPPNPGAGPPGPQPPPTFVSHPWTRSPRDFFMWNEVLEDQANRSLLPALVP